MSIQRCINEIGVAMEPSALFANAVTTSYVALSNYKYVDFLVTSGAGTAEDTTVTIKGKLGENGEAKTIPFAKLVNGEFVQVEKTGDTLTVGGTSGSCGKAIYRVDADALGREGVDRISLNTTAITSSTVPGAIVVVFYEPRYSE